MAKFTCSWLNDFLRIDLLEVPYDDLLLLLLLLPLEVGFWNRPSMAGRLLGLGLGREVHVKVGVLGDIQMKEGLENFGVVRGWWRMTEE